MSKDYYAIHSITFKPTNYRDEGMFRHPSDRSGLKFKRWEVSSLKRDTTFDINIHHPEDKFIDEGETVSFTEWRKKSEYFNPHGFLLDLIDNFEKIAEQDTTFNSGHKDLINVCSHYGNIFNDTLVDVCLIDTLSVYRKMYNLQSLNITPFQKAFDRYYDQAYLFYSTCKLINALFDPSRHCHILTTPEEFTANNYEIVIDETV